MMRNDYYRLLLVNRGGEYKSADLFVWLFELRYKKFNQNFSAVVLQ